MNTYRIHADYGATRRTITYKSNKTLQELKQVSYQKLLTVMGFTYLTTNVKSLWIAMG